MRNLDTIEERAGEQLYGDVAGADNMTRMPGKRQQLSSEQWNAHKSLIRTLYLEDDKTFDQVASELEQIHGFAPTKRQFTRKVSEWGFKKNTNRDERIRIMRDALKSDGNQAAEPLGKRLHKLKLQRWRKDLLKSYGAFNVVPKVISSNFKVNNLQSTTMSSKYTRMEYQSPPTESIAGASHGNFHKLTQSEGWASVDLPGSPKMRCFVKCVKLDLSDETEEIETLLLPEPRTLFSKRMELSINGSELNDVFHASIILQPLMGQVKHWENQHQKKHPKQAFKHDFDIWFPSGIELAPSPFNEMYPFPNAEEEPPPVHGNTHSATVMQYLNVQETQLKDTLKILQQVCTKSKSVIIEIIARLGFNYLRRLDFAAADQKYQEIIRMHELDGETGLEALRAQIMLNESLERQGRHEEAFLMHKTTHSKVVNSLPSGDPPILTSLRLYGRILGSMGNLDASEAVFRETLQVALCAFGIKHSQTILAIHGLSRAMQVKESFEESEKLSVIMVQLQQKMDPHAADMMCVLFRDLSISTHTRGRHSEALSLVKTTFDSAVLNLGEEHPTTLSCCNAYANLLLEQRYLEKHQQDQPSPENLLQRSVSLHIKVCGAHHPSTMHATFNYGKLLEKKGQFEQAAVMFHQVYLVYSKILPVLHRRTVSCFEHLAACYNAQSRWVEALSIFEELDKKIRTSAINDGPKLRWTREWIEYLHYEIGQEKDKLEAISNFNVE